MWSTVKRGGKREKTIETDSKTTQMLELANKDFKVTVISTFKDLKRWP